MDNCYLCGENFNGVDVVDHGEHIIQQAIGGTLIENEILCESCGKTLGREIDVPFNKMFDSICTRLDIRTHRGSNRSKSAKGFIFSKKDQYGNDLSGIEVLWKNGEVAPIKPFHRYISDSNKIIVYGAKNQLKNYLKKVNKDIERDFPIDSIPELITCSDIDGLILYPLEIVSDCFKKGMAKIAIGFASKFGIDRKFLNLVMDLKLNEIKKDAPLIQYHPISSLDKTIEKHKKEIRYYPSHTLILFTLPSNSRILVCYVELLSTFQWYVILSDSYDGPSVYQGHTQRVDKVDDHVFEPGRRYYKERSMILESLDINQEEINNCYEKQKDNYNSKKIEEIEIDLIRKKYIEKKYQVFFEEEVKSAIDFALCKSRNSIGSNSMSLSEKSDLMRNMRLFYNMIDDDERFNSSPYRRVHVLDGKYCDSVAYFMRSNHLPDVRQTTIEYGHKKVYMLSEYIEEKNINDKINS